MVERISGTWVTQKGVTEGMGASLHPLPPGECGMGLEGTWRSWQQGLGCSKGRKRASAGGAPWSRLQPVAQGDPPPPSPGMCLLSNQLCCHRHFAGQRPSPWLGLTLGCWEPPEPEQLLLHPRTSGEPPRGTAPCREMHRGHPDVSPALLQAPWASHPRIC